MLHRPKALGAVLIIGALAMGATAASGGESSVERTVRTAAELPQELLDQVPRTAEDAGLDFTPMVVEVAASTQAERSIVAASGLDVTEHAGHDGVQVVISDQEQFDLLEDLGFRYDVVTPDLWAQEVDRLMADAAFLRATAVSDLPSGRDTYRVLQDFLDEIDQLVADNPEIAKRISLGTSVEGRDLAGIEIGARVQAPEDGRPVMLMFGAHHAREWPSAETPMEFAHDLIRNWNAGDERTVDLLSRARVIIVPVSNPDGFDASRTSGDLIDLNTVDGGDTVSILATPGNAYKRKNCRILPDVTQPAGACVLFPSPGGFGIGIDLNRNYGALWGGPGAAGTEPDPDESINGSSVLSPIYRGPAPFSEPETQAIRTLISTRQVTTLISNHTFSNLLLRPVGVLPNVEGPDGFPIGYAPDECFTTADGRDLGMQTLGELMTAQTGYSNQFGWELYDTTGTTEDYSYNATGGYGYTFEIGPNQFHPPFQEVIDEYLGETEAAEGVTTDNAGDLTTPVGRDCPGSDVEPGTTGGGLREAYYLALENAADTATHSVLTGSAPAGATIEVTRTGTFPLWDGTPVEDTVTTSMTVQDGADVAAAAGPSTVPFTYHVNPSTRPFVASRPYSESDVTIPPFTETSQETYTGNVADSTPNKQVEIEVTEGLDSLVLQLSAEPSTDDWDLTLFGPDAEPIDTSASPSSDERIVLQRPDGLTPGTYVANVENFSAIGTWELVVTLGTLEGDEQRPLQFTPGSTEQWTVTCSLDGEELARDEVEVDRGETFDLGSFCVAAAGVGPAPDLAATGGGVAALAAMALGGAMFLVGRRRED